MIRENNNALLVEKWKPMLEHADLPSITDIHRRDVTATILENTERALREDQNWSPQSLLEATPANVTGNVQNYDPVLITLVRRAMPNLIAYDIAGVQPMTGPTGLIFAMRSNYANSTNAAIAEAFYNEADTDWTGTGTHAGTTGTANTANSGTGVATAGMETNTAFTEMTFSIEKDTVTAKSRALKAEYSTELAQDLKAVHGLDAETELANILTSELLADINRELIRTIYTTAVRGTADTTTAGTFDLDVDANGRWSVEKFKGLLFQVEREANAIAKATRRGKGNIILCSSDVASALQMAGVLDYTPAIAGNNGLKVDDTGNTFAGILNGRFKVYIDPYAGGNYMVVGYKGTSSFDAGMFYCPYVPLQMVRAVGENSFQPKIGFKTRYGLTANPFAFGGTASNGALTANSNVYYRRSFVTNIL